MPGVEPTRIVVVAAFEAGDRANPCARNAMQCLRYYRIVARPGERTLEVTGHRLWKRGARPAAGQEGLLTPAGMQWRFEPDGRASAGERAAASLDPGPS